MAKQTEFGDRTVALNRRARHEYELLDSLEAGLELQGSEVRALREHGADLSDSWVEFSRNNQAFVVGMRIPRLDHARFGHDEVRKRRLLLHAAQIDKLRGSAEQERMTVVAMKCYFKNGRAKLEIALARGKKQYDKRQAVKARDAEREARQAIAAARKG